MTSGRALPCRFLRDSIHPVALSLGLDRLPEHASTIVASFAFFLVLHTVISPNISARFFPDAFGKASRKAQNNWSIHVVSEVHALIVVPLAISCLRLPSLEADRAFGWDDLAGTVQAIACGYFLWDSFDAVVNFVSIGFVVHGLACLAIYTVAFRPFFAYYGVRCLLWETSTVFLNVHWFLDKTGGSGSTFQLVNGMFLLTSFFGMRIVYGGMVVIIRVLVHVVPSPTSAAVVLSRGICCGQHHLAISKLVLVCENGWQYARPAQTLLQRNHAVGRM